MKLSKKVLAGFSAIALLVTASIFTSCGDDDEADAFDGNKVDFDNSYVLIKKDAEEKVADIQHAKDATETKTGYENKANTSYYYRAFKQTATKHTDSICTVTLTPNSTGRDGVAGYIFGLKEATIKNTKGEDVKVYDFGVASTSINRTTQGKVDYYVSYYQCAAVKDNNFTALDDFSDADGNKLTSDGTTIGDHVAKVTDIKTDGNVWNTLDGITKQEDGTYKVAIEARNDNGSYAVKFYDYSALDEKGKIKTGALAKGTATITADLTGDTEAKQYKLAYYANIDPSKHLTAQWDYSDTNGAAVVFED